MNQTRVSDEHPSTKGEADSLILGFHGVRYQVKDVSRSVAFYTKQLGFKLEMQQLPAFANVSIGNLKILLSGPGHRAHARCLIVVTKNPVGGIE